MKKIVPVLAVFFLLAAMLANPIVSVKAAAHGLLLWYEHILPALLPFSILSDILIHSNACFVVSEVLYVLIHPFLPCSRQGTFPVVAGFLFGFPMGSRICAQMVCGGQLDASEADCLFPFCNNISPIFIISFIVHDTLGNDGLLPVTLLCLYIPAWLVGYFLLRRQHASEKKMPAAGLKINFSIIDAGIMNSFEMMCKLGGYIMLFSIITELMQNLCPGSILVTGLAAPLEITNGIALLQSLALNARIKYTCILALTAFGGLCSMVQTYSMVYPAGLSMKKYIRIRLLLACTSGICAYLLYPFF